MFTLQESCKELEKCLNDSQCIDWNLEPVFCAIHMKHEHIIKKCIIDKKKKILFDVPGLYTKFSKDEVKNETR